MLYIFQIIFVWDADGALSISHVTLHENYTLLIE